MLNRCLIVLVSILSVSCATTAQDQFDTDSVFEGMAFWVHSPLQDVRPYSFHWYGDELSVLSPLNGGLESSRLLISDCDGLEEALGQLEGTILETVRIATGESSPTLSPDIVIGGPTYTLKYYPPNMAGSITLSSYESHGVPWTVAGRKVRELVDRCSDS